MISRRRDGSPVEVYDGQGSAIRWLYETAPGRIALGLLVQPWVSKTAGWFLDRGVSRGLVGPFVRKNQLDLSDYPVRKYRSFNDFFTRTVLPERRPVDMDPSHLVSPCDGKLTAIPITPEATFQIKGVDYTLEGLLRSAPLAERYQGGMLLLFRLSVDDYHRYCFPADGTPGEEHRIPGVYHTVNPRAAAVRPIYRENTRTYQTLETEHFGQLLQMEVGAMMVGRIKNQVISGPVKRGQEKGMFEFGGSTIVLLTEPGRLRVDEDILRNSREGEETLVKMGERIGTK